MKITLKTLEKKDSKVETVAEIASEATESNRLALVRK